jgi:mono/diheme cytochrome c family protein
MGLLALSTIATLALIAGIVVAVAFAAGVVAITLRGRARRGPDIPSAMKPGPADDVLERRALDKIMAWGVLFTLVFALNVALVWLTEPGTNVDDEIELVSRSVERGRLWFQVTSEENPTGFGCERCHGPEGAGGMVTPFTDPETGEQIPFQEPALNDVCLRRPIESTETQVGIREIIEEGSPGTPMPSWSVRVAGPMNDQQIQDLINYIVEINEKTIGTGPDNQCLNPPTGTGTEAPGEGGEETPSPGATETPTEGASPSPEETGQA